MIRTARAWLALTVVAAGVTASAELARETPVTMEVGRVNDAVVTAREYVEALRRLRFRQMPETTWREAAWEECVRFKLVQLMATELGRLDEASDDAVRATWAQENARRADARARGRVFYGPAQLTWEQFRALWEDTVEREYGRRELAARGGGAGDEHQAFVAAMARMRAAARATRDTARWKGLTATSPLRADAAAGAVDSSQRPPK